MRNNSFGDWNGPFILFWVAFLGFSVASVVLEGGDILTKQSTIEAIFTLAILFTVTVHLIVTAFKMIFESFNFKRRRRPKKKEFGKFPHFGDGMKEEKVTEIIEKSVFSAYVTRDGETLKNVTISDDHKWICILGGYFPVDLVCGYNEKSGELLGIDGAAIMLPRRAKRLHIRKDIDAFFRDRGIYYKSLPKNADDCYYEVRNTIGLNIDREDFGRIRYLWEKGIANEEDQFWVTDDDGNDCRPGKESDINEGIYQHVLSDKEVQEIAENVRGGSIMLSRYLRFEGYRNEFSVCNGVELLDKLGYPMNSEGVDFLFRCLGDVDEAYFMPAVEVLKTYPEQLLQEKIEAYIKHAYENYDAVGLAGLMYLAKEINYEIRYIADMSGSTKLTDGGMAYLKQA